MRELDGIDDGDWLIVHPVAVIDIENKIYILRLGNETVARHAVHEGARLKLWSSNHDYQTISPDEVEVLGRVLGHFNWQAD